MTTELVAWIIVGFALLLLVGSALSWAFIELLGLFLRVINWYEMMRYKYQITKIPRR